MMSESLIKSSDVQGMHVVGIGEAKLGSAREIFIHLPSGRIAFVIVEAPSLLGGSGKYHPVPWSAVRYDPVAGALQIERTKDDFKASPSYDREQLANPGYGWDEQSTRYFATSPPA
jgi:hypothetical protein